MPRPTPTDVQVVVSRELTRLGVQNMAYSDFIVQAEMSDDERAAFQAALTRKQSFFYVDAVNFPQPVPMVGTFVDNTGGS